MEAKIGEIFEANGRRYRVEKKEAGCDGCAFKEGKGCSRTLLLEAGHFQACSRYFRLDRTSVIFREVQEAEVPKKENGIAEKPQGPLEVVAEMTMPDKADVPAGKGVKINGRTYMCEESISGCRLCALRSTSACEAVQCACYDRADGKEVIFTEVSDKPADKPSLTEKEPADINKFEYAVGEIFERDGVKYQCVAEKRYESCADCAFDNLVCIEYACQAKARKDKTHVLFKKVGEKANPESETERRRMAAEDFEFFVREFAPEALSLYRAMVRWQPFTAGKKCMMLQPRRNDRAATDIIETAARKINSLAEGELQALDGQRAQNAFDRISELAGEIIKICGDFKKE